MSDLKTELTKELSHLVNGLSFDVSAEQIDKLVGYVLLMHKWNKTYNLSSVRDPHEMLIKHILDSIIVTPYLQGSNIADVGTGPGLPGIPLAIMCVNKNFTLIDSLGKRIRFIKQAIHELNISNVVPIQARVETLEAKQFNIIVSRAFASLSDMLFWCEHLVADDGRFYALKGQLRKEELDQVPAQFKIESSLPLSVPSLEGERHLVKIIKQPLM